MNKDCNNCEDKLCRTCDKPFVERHHYEEEDLRFFEHIVCLFVALGLVGVIWAAMWYFWTLM